MSESARARIWVFPDQQIGEVHPHIFGHFTEHLGNCIYNGHWAEMLRNRKFAGHDSDYAGVVDPWKPVGEDISLAPRIFRGAYKGDDEGFHLDDPVYYEHDNTTYYVPGQSGRGQAQRIEIVRPDGEPHGVGQDGLGVRSGRTYVGRVVLRAEGPSTVEVSLGGQTHEIAGVDDTWKTYGFTFTPTAPSDNELFSVTTRQKGRLWIGAASLMPEETERGWRRDVNDLVRGIRAPMVRWPGGNFVSGYHWQDGIGDRDRRPVRFDRAWNAFEPNDVGIDEFIEFCRFVDTEPYVCINTGDGTVEEAAAWVEYCNGPTGSRYGALRARNGHPEPYEVIYWGIGNEMWGNWQTGHVDAETYARECVAYARAMRAADSNGRRLKLLAIGAIPQAIYDGWPLWNRTVARIAGADVDYITIHHYAYPTTPWVKEPVLPDDEYRSKVSAPSRVADLIAVSRKEIDAHAPAGKRIPISFDEWDAPSRRDATGEGAVDNWPLAQGIYSAGIFNMMMRNADHVTMGAQTMLVNVGGLILSSHTSVGVTPKYLAFKLYVDHSGPISLRTKAESPVFAVPSVANMPARRDEPYLDVAATGDREGSRIWLHVVNRNPRRAITAQIDLGKVASDQAVAHTLTGPDPWAKKTSRLTSCSPGGDEESVRITSSPVTLPNVTFPACSATTLEIELA